MQIFMIFNFSIPGCGEIPYMVAELTARSTGKNRMPGNDGAENEREVQAQILIDKESGR